MFDNTPLGAVPASLKVELLKSISKALEMNISSSTCVITGMDVLKQQEITQLSKWGCLWVRCWRQTRGWSCGGRLSLKTAATNAASCVGRAIRPSPVSRILCFSSPITELSSVFFLSADASFSIFLSVEPSSPSLLLFSFFCFFSN